LQEALNSSLTYGKSYCTDNYFLVLFLGAGYIAYLIQDQFKPVCYERANSSQYREFENNFNEKFISTEYAEIKDLGKSFLSILIAVFVASITFSEKIVNFNSASSWAKSILVLCWIFLLLGIVLAGTGMVYIASCFNQAIHMPCPENIELYSVAFVCFVLAGLCFGLGLTSMLCAGIISMINQSKRNIA
jgi:hypothetical protein